MNCILFPHSLSLIHIMYSWTSDWFIRCFSGCHINDKAGWCHIILCVCLKRHNIKCFYIIMDQKSPCHPYCIQDRIWTSGWQSHANIKLCKPHLIFPFDCQSSVPIFHLEHNRWHNLIISCSTECLIHVLPTSYRAFLKHVILLETLPFANPIMSYF